MRNQSVSALILLAALVAVPPAMAESDSLESYESTAMTRGYFHAASHQRDPTALGGYASSANFPRQVDRKVPSGRLSLIAIPEEPAAFCGKYQGFRVILANDTNDTITFDVADSRLPIIREAIDLAGHWQPIEYLPSSWCGNSYHRLFLPSAEQWSFAAPVYQGSYRTRMRFTLRGGSDRSDIHSNEFEGSVNIGQFNRAERQGSISIMDPTID